MNHVETFRLSRHTPVDQVQVRHLLTELLLELLDDRTSQEILSWKTKHVSDGRKHSFITETHTHTASPLHSAALHHVSADVPQDVHRCPLTLLVFTERQDEASEQRNNGTQLLLSDKTTGEN